MAEPQPSGIREGDQGPSAVPASKEDRKTANALSNLDTKVDNDTTLKQADTEALGKAMRGLDVNGSAGREARAKVVKIDVADVALLMQQLDILKSEATELLKANDGNVSKAIAAWITA